MLSEIFGRVKVSAVTRPELRSFHEHTHIISLLAVSSVKQPCSSDRTHACNTSMPPHYDAAGEPDHAKLVCERYKKDILLASMRPGFLSVTAGNLISRDYNQSKSKEWMQSSLHGAGPPPPQCHAEWKK